MRLVVARCEVLYTGGLTARLPEAVRLLMFKADGSFLVHDDAGGFRPLNCIRRVFRPQSTPSDRKLRQLRRMPPRLEPLCFEHQSRQARLGLRLMLFTFRPEDRLASGDGMKLAVGSTYVTRTFENREDLRGRCRVTSDPSA